MAARSCLQRNDNFFRQRQETGADVEGKVRRAFQRCAESGVLNLSSQRLTGDLPASVHGFQDALWAECWWDQCPVTKIDVSHNSLVRIPPEISRLGDCTIFLAVSNELQGIPDEMLTGLPLKQLNLKQNMIRDLPGPAFAAANHLVELVLSENRLSVLPAEAFGLQSLEVLEVANNHLTCLPDGHWACNGLKRLDVTSNRIGPTLPSALRHCGALRELSAASNVLQEVGDLFVIEDGHGWRSSLVALNLNANRIGPRLRISGTEALDSLSIASNRISVLDLGGFFPRLSTVVAESNQIVQFPEGLLPSHAPVLCTLDLLNNSITALPPELGLSTTLKRIALVGNPLRSIRPEVLRGSAEALKKFLRTRIEGPGDIDAIETAEVVQDNLIVELRTAAATHELSMERRGLLTLPPLPAGLRVLRVSGNALKAEALTSALGLADTTPDRNLGRDLRSLGVAHNALGKVSRVDGIIWSFVEGLPSLQDLDLSFNNLHQSAVDAPLHVPESSSLTRMDLSGNMLTSFPGQLLVACPALHEFRLRQNRISSLVGAACAAGSVVSTLDLEENCLSTVPAWLPSALPHLRTLLLANNNIGSTLPPEWGFWDSLRAATLVGNPLKGVRQAILAKGWPTVAVWLRDRLPEGAASIAAIPSVASRGSRTGGGQEPAEEAPVWPSSSRCAPPGAEGGQDPLGRVVMTRSRTLPSPSASSDHQQVATRDAPNERAQAGASSTAMQSVAALPRQNAAAVSERLHRLRVDVRALEEELMGPGNSRTKQSAVNHSLRIKRAELFKAEREHLRLSTVDDHLDSS